jgi:hypothetical protein
MQKKIMLIQACLLLLILIAPSILHAQPVFDDDVNDVPY